MMRACVPSCPVIPCEGFGGCCVDWMGGWLGCKWFADERGMGWIVSMQDSKLHSLSTAQQSSTTHTDTESRVQQHPG